MKVNKRDSEPTQRMERRQKGQRADKKYGKPTNRWTTDKRDGKPT